MRIAINGFGRIGRAILRKGFDDPSLEFVHVNDLTSPEFLAGLLQRDTVHGRWHHQVSVADGGLMIDGTHLPVSAERDPTKLPWAELDVDVVLECTGVFRSREAAGQHLTAGAKRVVVSAPGKGVDATLVVGVNHTDYDPETHVVVSNASCTTNCLAPIAKVVHEAVGIDRGFMTTIHSYTMDQMLLDAPHKKDPRRSRAAAQNIVPTSTGAAAAIGLVIPELEGRLGGLAVRVPTPNGSLVDLVFETETPTNADDLLAALRAAADGPLAGILEVSDEPLVSSDIIGNPASSIVDAELLAVSDDGHIVKILAWYDNEWGFSSRMLDLARHIGDPR